jgi:hypothetical protein
MITIVAHFHAPVVKFIFGGRNYGQNRNEGDTIIMQARAKPKDSVVALLLDCRRALIASLGIMRHDVFGECKYAALSIELDPVRRIRCKLDFPGFCPQPGDYIPNRTSPPELCQQ